MMEIPSFSFCHATLRSGPEPKYCCIRTAMSIRNWWTRADHESGPNRGETEMSESNLNMTADGKVAEHELEGFRNRFLFFNAIPSWVVSFVLHVFLILMLALVFLPDNLKPPITFEVSDVSGEQLDSIDVDLNALDLTNSQLEMESLVQPEQKLSDMPLPEVPTEPLQTESLSELTSDFTPAAVQESSGGGEMASRTAENRSTLGKRFGATTESEQSVDLALEWLAKHQLEDGSWNFDHSHGPGVRSRKDTGSYANCINGATALALLPFFGAGNTHYAGDYKETVAKGLKFLTTHGERQNDRISWWETNGEMYSHGLASIALCEAYAMTNDQSLLEFATGSIRYIEWAQDQRGGGWRYEPKSPGDTSVVGWQIMALKSAKMSGIETDDKTWKLAKKFLDSVSTDYGAFYGYMSKPSGPPGLNKARTAVGLLSRMYMGWERDQPGLVEGVTWIGEYRPSTGTRTNPTGANMYYNYYATQVMKHYGGEMWDKWNVEMRDFLVATQDTDGAERGSWFFARSDDLSPDAGGRLYCTCMAAMTLEVYYRFLPLYEKKATEDAFPLD